MTDPTKYQRTIEGEQVFMDDAKFDRVLFKNCQIVYSGGEIPLMNGCYFDTCNWTFRGPAARTAQLMRSFYAGGLRPIAENWINEIRGEKSAASEKVAVPEGASERPH